MQSKVQTTSSISIIPRLISTKLPNKPVSCLYFNAQSLTNKLVGLHQILQDGKHDIIAITEAWLNLDQFSDAMVCPYLNYTLFRCDRKSRSGGGVLILVRSSLRCVAVKSNSSVADLEVLAIDILDSDSTKARFLCVYRPPNFPDSISEQLFDHLTLLCDVSYIVVMCGDFNFPRISWEDQSSLSGSSISISFLQLCQENALLQYVSEPTRGSSVLDLVFCNDELSIYDVFVAEPFSTSDHASLLFSLRLSPISNHKVLGYNFPKGDFQQMSLILSQVEWPPFFSSCTTVQDCYDDFCTLLFSLVEQFVPLKQYRQNFKDYPEYIQRMMKEKRRLWRSRHFHEGQTKYLKCAHDLDTALKKYSRNIEKNIVKRNNKRAFYSFVKKCLKKKSGIAPLRRPDGQLVTDDEEKANLLSQQFASVFTVDDGHSPIFPSRTSAVHDNVVFEPSDVLRAMKKMPAKLSGSPDGLPAFFIKTLGPLLALPLAYIFNLSFISATLPHVWRTAIVCPIYKKQPADLPVNYRPISLTSACCRLMEAVIKTSVVDYLQLNSLITADQHGFMQRKSTTTQLLETLGDWTIALQNKKCIDAVYIDLAKAFDSVSHRKLLIKIKAYGITGPLLKWIECYLSCRTQQVRVGNSLSSKVNCTSGVPQGSVLGPLLFLIYVNDVADIFQAEPSSCKLFADDMKLYTAYSVNSSYDWPSIVNFKKSIRRFEHWSNQWQLKIAAEKCSVLYIGSRNRHSEYSIADVLLPKVDGSIRDLGVLVRPDLKSSSHCQSIVTKAYCTSNYILRSLKWNDASHLMQAFNVYVRPILEYASQVFSPHLQRDIVLIEQVQRRFTKKVFLRCFDETEAQSSYEQRMKHLSIQSLESRRICADLCLFYKIVHGRVDMKVPEDVKPHNTRTRGHCFRYEVNTSNINARHYYYFNRVIRLWNTLPDEVVTSPTLAVFRSRVIEAIL